MKTKLLKKYRKIADENIWIGHEIGLGKQPYIIFENIPSTEFYRVIELDRCDTKEEAKKRVIEIKRNYIMDCVKQRKPLGVKRVNLY